MRYEVTTGLTPRAALDQAITYFGPGGAGLQILAQPPLGLVFQGGGGHVAITVQPGAVTTLELETWEWDVAVQHFMAQVSRRRWWSRWWRWRKPVASLPLTFNILHTEGESSEPRDAQRLP